MPSFSAALQAFRKELQKRVPRMLKGCMADSVSVGPVENNKLLVTVTWIDKSGLPVQYQHQFSATAIFVLNGNRIKLQRSACRYVDEVIQGTLRMRMSRKA